MCNEAVGFTNRQPASEQLMTLHLAAAAGLDS
jgi:hypothetical protein